MKALILALSFISFSAHSFDLVVSEGSGEHYKTEIYNTNQTKIYKEGECLEVYNKIVKNLLPKVQDKLDKYKLKETPLIVKSDFCGISDMTPGSWGQERVVRYCIELKAQGYDEIWTGSLGFMTTGDFWCTGESLLEDEIVEVWIH